MSTLHSNTSHFHTPLVCPHCHGEGFFVYDGGPGCFDERFGNWLPTEVYVPCPCCGGVGEVEPEDAAGPVAALLTPGELFDLDDEELPF